MKGTRCITKWACFCCLFIAGLHGCKKSESSSIMYEIEPTVHADMQYYDFDKVENLTHFFDSISKQHVIPIRDIDGDGQQNKNVFDCIERIDGFRKGRYKYYPDSLVRVCIGTLGLECAYRDNHCDGLDMVYTEWFLMCAAYYSPNISYLVDRQTSNHKVGVLNLGTSYNDSPWWSYLVLKRDKGYEVRRIGEDYVKIEKIFHLSDNDNRSYYLCSNESHFGFLQLLVMETPDNDFAVVAQCDSLPIDNSFDYDQLYFNQEKKVWYCCNMNRKTGKLIPVFDQPVLKLKLEGMHSHFVE